MSRLRRGAAVVGALGAACLAWGTLVEPRVFRLRRFELPLLPAGSPPVRVLHLSDLHLLPGQRAKLDWVSRLAGLEPDLVVDTGDNLASARSVEPLLRALGRLTERPGAFVLGSNDYFSPQLKNPAAYLWSSPGATPEREEDLPWQTLVQHLSDAGWHDLTSRRATVEVHGVRIELRGTDDAHLDRDDYASVAGEVSPGHDVSIGVTHAPYLRVLDAMAADRVDLVLAGHTHGGQVCLPGGRALVTNCDIEPSRVKGLSSHEARTADGGIHRSALHVSAGLGMSPYAPYRFACPPEASLLTLTARPGL
ncbi:metallophosphoesterase [Desertihabitans brevis]|uniref:Metallophosphoesterase n=1 Tax=Desertihabitans brevis TaxID=2268447 RepID=A0A367YQH4_9ACTN|nr:metallophosphoesterase [Desertihabitans brevis]RCK68030.1 metallophosphoesterase [Desertihabitans brevis]